MIAVAVGVGTTVVGGALSNAINGGGSSSGGTNAIGAVSQAYGAFTSAGQLAAAAQSAANVNVGAATQQGNILAPAAATSANQIAQGATAAGAQNVAAINQALNVSQQTLQQQAALNQPYINAGNTALNTLNAGLQPGGAYNTAFTMSDAQNMPAYTFAEQQGQQAIQNVAAMGGQVQGTNLQQQSANFAENTASQYETQAFNQWLAQNNLSLGALQNMVKTGQTSTAALQSALSQYGVSAETLNQNLGSAEGTATTNAANTQAAGTQGVANAQAAEAVNIGNAQSAGIMGVGSANAAGTVGVTNALGAGLTTAGNNLSLANAQSTAAGAAYMNNLNSASNLSPTAAQSAQYSSDLGTAAAPTTEVSASDLGSTGASVDTSSIPSY